jgi:hypothetical protein
MRKYASGEKTEALVREDATSPPEEGWEVEQREKLIPLLNRTTIEVKNIDLLSTRKVT